MKTKIPKYKIGDLLEDDVYKSLLYLILSYNEKTSCYTFMYVFDNFHKKPYFDKISTFNFDSIQYRFTKI